MVLQRTTKAHHPLVKDHEETHYTPNHVVVDFNWLMVLQGKTTHHPLVKDREETHNTPNHVVVDLKICGLPKIGLHPWTTEDC